MTIRSELPRKLFLQLITLLPAAVALEACTKTFELNVTATVSPTETITPSNIPKPTNTIRPSDTPTPTDTPTATNKPTNTPTETPSPTFTTEQLHPGWKEIMAKEIGSNWDSYINCENYELGGIKQQPGCTIKGITDGELLTDPFIISTIEGEPLLTMKAGIHLFYLDLKGNLQSVILPKIMQLVDGRIFAYNFGIITEKKMNELIANEGYMETERPGLTIYTSVAADVQIYNDYWSKIFGQDPQFSNYQYVWSLADRYQKSRSEQWQNFIEAGDAKIGIFISMLLVGSDVLDLELPGE